MRRLVLLLLLAPVAMNCSGAEPDGAGSSGPGAAFAHRLRIEVVGCQSLRDQDCGRLARFGLEYGWESTEPAVTRLPSAGAGSRPANDAGRSAPAWVRVRSDAQGHADLPVPGDAAAAHVLHVRLDEPGWDWFTFPGPIHPATLDGAAAFDVQRGTRTLRLTLVRTRRAH